MIGRPLLYILHCNLHRGEIPLNPTMRIGGKIGPGSAIFSSSPLVLLPKPNLYPWGPGGHSLQGRMIGEGRKITLAPQIREGSYKVVPPVPWIFSEIKIKAL